MVLEQKSDILGALSSGLCLIHCVLTPFLFIAQSHSLGCCTATPGWWSTVDYLFLIISFFAIYKSTKATTKNWMKYALWMSWFALFFIIMNEHFGFVSLAEESIYLPSLSLVFLHIYNSKYCKCTNEEYCIRNLE